MQKPIYYITEDVFRGVFDADGSIYPGIRVRPKRNGLPSITVNWIFSLEMASFNSETVDNVGAFLGTDNLYKATRKSGRSQGLSIKRVKFGPASNAGKKLTEIYERIPPKVDNRLSQFRVFQEVYKIQEKGNRKTPAELLYILLLLRHIATVDKRRVLIANLIKAQNFSINDQRIALGKASAFLKNLEKEILTLQTTLPKTKLSNDYMIGYTLGDGSFNILYSIREDGKLEFIPQWSITEPFRPLLQAFVYTIGKGYIAATDQYLCKHTKTLKQFVVPIFAGISMPPYKQNQFSIMVKAMSLLEQSKVYDRLESLKNFVDLTYKMSSKPRTRTKDQYIKIAQDFFNRKK